VAFSSVDQRLLTDHPLAPHMFNMTIAVGDDPVA